jgi:hypothetical protein
MQDTQLEKQLTEFLDMAGTTPEQRISSLESKAETTKEKLGTLETSIGGVSSAITEIKNDLKWHSRIGWGLASIYATIFGLFVGVYLPDKFNDKLPSNFKEEWGGLKQNISTIQDRLTHLTPNAINDILLLPSTGNAKPASVTTQLRKASQLINVSLRTQIPGDPAALKSLGGRVANIAALYKGPPELKSAALSLGVRLDAYAIASNRLLGGLRPETEALPESSEPSRASYLMRFTMNCTHPEAHFLGIAPTAKSRDTVVFEVRVVNCSQQMEGPRWIDVHFQGATIEYNGGPLSLADVTFNNCKFKFGNDPRSKDALAVISASNGKPVSLLTGH